MVNQSFGFQDMIYKHLNSRLLNCVSDSNIGQAATDFNIRTVLTKTIISVSIISTSLIPFSVNAKPDLPSIEKCFGAIEKELDPIRGESLRRIDIDIQNENWDDIKLFTREYDAGFRGGVLKNAWKQFEGDIQKTGIEITNSFTFDLIALNKAARNKDHLEATRRLGDVRADLQNFLDLKSKI